MQENGKGNKAMDISPLLINITAKHSDWVKVMIEWIKSVFETEVISISLLLDLFQLFSVV